MNADLGIGPPSMVVRNALFTHKTFASIKNVPAAPWYPARDKSAEITTAMKTLTSKKSQEQQLQDCGAGSSRVGAGGNNNNDLDAPTPERSTDVRLALPILVIVILFLSDTLLCRLVLSCIIHLLVSVFFIFAIQAVQHLPLHFLQVLLCS